MIKSTKEKQLKKRTRREFLQLAAGTSLAGTLAELRLERMPADGKPFRRPDDEVGVAGPPSPQGDGRLVTIDASKPATVPLPDRFVPTFTKAPGRSAIGANSRYLTLGNRAWFPVMGEFHYVRYPDEFWEDELLKIKAGGVQIVATYVFWIYQEEVQGQFNWVGRRNLRRFMELCGRHGLYAFARIGPWSHGEVRNGGFPDWLIHSCKKLRRNDPCYLGYVRPYFAQIGRQLSGLYWDNGGPIVGVQLENEYMLRGPGAGAAHIEELKKIAEASGIKAPLYTVTGWGHPQFPPREAMPVFSGYPYQFWSREIHELPPSPEYFFTAIRNDQDVGTNLRPLYPVDPEIDHYPFLTAELGAGMETSYHRRPVVDTDDVAAFILAKLGCGANLLGYYMYHGGANMIGKLSTLQESQATGYPNDMPVISYDYQAPIGEFGQVRPSYGALKIYHLFLQDFGNALAPMVVQGPDVQPVSLYDRQTPRVTARTSGNQGFVFVNNYQRNYPLREQKNLHIAVKLPDETVKIPEKPITVPAGAYFIWPVNLDLNGSLLKYATAQLLCRTTDGETPIYFFFESPGVAPEFAFDGQTVSTVAAPHGFKRRGGGQIHVGGIAPGSDVAISVKSRAGKAAKIVLLKKEQAENCYRLPFGGTERIFISRAHIFAKGEMLYLRSRNVQNFEFSVFPALGQFKSRSQFSKPVHDGLFTRYGASITPKTVSVGVEKVRHAQALGPPKMGKQVALAPRDGDFSLAAEWKIHVPAEALDGLNELYLRVDYAGDVARLHAGRQLLDDNFYNGTVWEVGLKRFAQVALGRPLKLRIYPLAKGAPVYIPQGAWPSFPPSGQIAEVRKITASPEYQVTLAAS